MMNVRFSLLNMAQRILDVTLPIKANKMLISKIFIWWVFRFKHVQYWLTKEIQKYPIKKSKYIYSLPQRLSTYIDLLHRYGKKNVCGKFLFFNGFSDMTFSFDNFVNYQWQIQESGHIRKTTKEEKFSAPFFFTMPMKIRIPISRQPLR
jgi:hypothetical protein